MTAEAIFDQDVLDQVAIFNEIVTYIRSNVLTGFKCNTNQYFETVDFKYEYMNDKTTITLKPTSEIYPKIKSLKLDVISNYSRVHVYDPDNIVDTLKIIVEKLPGIKLYCGDRSVTITDDIIEIMRIERCKTDYVNNYVSDAYPYVKISMPKEIDDLLSKSVWYKYLCELYTIKDAIAKQKRYRLRIDAIAYGASKIKYSQVKYNVIKVNTDPL